MTSNETTMIMAVLYAAYPQFYAKKTPDEIDSIVALWAEMFVDDPAEIVTAAVKSFISTDTKGFPPVIGIIKDHVLRVTQPPQKTALEAWAEVKNALSRSNYHASEEFAKLDPVIQRIVGAPSQLREWAQADIDTLDSVIASNFQRSYRACEKNYRESLCLPSAVSSLIKELSSAKTLAAEPEKQEPKALPVSVEAIVNEVREIVGEPPARPEYNPMSQEDFEKRKQEILKQLTED